MRWSSGVIECSVTAIRGDCVTAGMAEVERCLGAGDAVSKAAASANICNIKNGSPSIENYSVQCH